MPTKAVSPRRMLPVLPNVVPSGINPILTPTRVLRLNGANVGVSTALSMERASTLTLRIHDPAGEVWKSKALAEDMRLTFAEHDYVDEWRLWRSRGIGTIAREAEQTVLTFWDAGSAALKLKTKPLSRSAGSLNWEGWVRLLAGEVKGEYALKVLVLRPNSTPPAEDSSDESETTAGWSSETRKKVTVKGAPANAEQLRVIDQALKVAVKERASGKATLALIEACIVESTCKNLTYGDRDSIGVLQVRVGIHGRDVAASVEKSCEAFLRAGFTGRGGAIKLAKDNPGMSAGQIAQACQGSGYPTRYDQVQREAREIIELWSGVTLDKWSQVTGPADTESDYGEEQGTRPTEWRRGRPGEPESSLKALARTAEGLGQRSFVAARRLVAARDQDLILAAPHLSFSLIGDSMLRATPNVAHDGNHRLTQITVSVDREQWGAPPGSVVEIADSGEIERTWLVQEVRGSDDSLVAEVTLQQPTTKIPKPAKRDNNEDDGNIRTSMRKVDNTYPGSPVPGQRPHASTHPTAGLPGYPAFDYMAPAGTPCVAPASGNVSRLSGRDPKAGGPPGGALGYSIYLRGDNNKEYFMTHLDRVRVKKGQRVSQGEQIAIVAAGPASWSSPHVHMGVKG